MAKMMVTSDKKVGVGGGDFFTPTETIQRMALVPCEITLAELEPTQEELVRAQTDEAAAQGVRDKKEMAKLIHELLNPKVGVKPGAEKWTNEHGKEVILFPRADGDTVVFIENSGAVKFDPAIPAHAWPKEPAIAYGVAVIRYNNTNPEGVVQELPQSEWYDLQDGNHVKFGFDFMMWNLSDSRMREWKRFHTEHPAIFTDFKVSLKQQGKSKRIQIEPCGVCVWRTAGPNMLKRMVIAGRKQWEQVPKKICTEYSTADLARLLNVNVNVARTEKAGLKGLLGD